MFITKTRYGPCVKNRKYRAIQLDINAHKYRQVQLGAPGTEPTAPTPAFKLKYEFVERGCEHLAAPAARSGHKGRVVLRPGLGTQRELSDGRFTSGDISQSSEYKQYAEMIRDNLNFHCKVYE